MPRSYLLHTKDSVEFSQIEELLKPHFLRCFVFPKKKILEKKTDEQQVIASVQQWLQEKNSRWHVLLLKNNTLLSIHKNSCARYINPKGIHHCISDFILNNYQYSKKHLSCRKESLHLIDSYTKNGSPDFSTTPEKWIRGNTFFNSLRPKPFYDRLLAFNMDLRGTYLKVWKIRAQHNYFHPSVNSGLPLTKKKDEVHEGTFMMHDMFHHIFFDPIVTGHETEEEKTTYIACRMMSEACTLVLADMIAVAHSNIELDGYDITKRRIYPLFKSLRLDAVDIETVRKILYANCVYCLYGDTSVYEALHAGRESLEQYTSKYYKFFSGDFAWNEINIAKMTDEIQSNEGLKQYFDGLHPNFKAFNTRDLTKKIKRADGMLSFNALFEVFWDQLELLIRYQNTSDLVQYKKTCFTKYISGQMYIVYKYSDQPGAQELINAYYSQIETIQNSDNSDSIQKTGDTFISKIAAFISELGKSGILTQAEVLINTLHVPHFPPEYVDYDKSDKYYETLEGISQRILGPHFVKEDFTYQPLSKELREYYYQIVK